MTSDEEDGDVIQFEFSYLSRYGQSPRSKHLFEKYQQMDCGVLLYEHPNRLYFSDTLPFIDDTGMPVSPQDVDQFAKQQAIHFFQLICAYEICARQCEMSTRVREKYQKVLVSRQICMIFETHMAS